MILFWDVESTGFPNKRWSLGHASQPKLVQFACSLEGNSGIELERHSLICRPAGWKITKSSEAVHKISQERALDEGVPLADIVDVWESIVARNPLCVAHYAAFDVTMMEIATLGCRPRRVFRRPPDVLCTMRMATDLGLSPVRLASLYERFTNQPLEGAHDAMVDVDACRLVYRRLVELRDRPFAMKEPVAAGSDFPEP